MESPHQANNYHNVTPRGQGNVGTSIQHFEHIKEKERKAVQEELKFEMEENCRIEYDDLMDCQARMGYFSLWGCRQQQFEVGQCEKRYKDKAYRKKREIEIVEARQQQGHGGLMIYNRDVANLFGSNPAKGEPLKGEVEINGVKVNIDPKENLRVKAAMLDFGAEKHFSPQFLRAAKKDVEIYGHPGRKPTIRKHEGETLEKLFS